MESYKKHIADNPKVAMVHISLDEQESAAAKWAAKEGFPWLTILLPKVKESGFEELTSGLVPDYLLLSADGTVLAKGKEDCFKKIASLGNSVASN